MDDTGILRWRNPLAVPSRAVKSIHYGGGSRNYSMSAGSTTDTVNYTIRNNAIIRTTSLLSTLIVVTTQTFKHTVANAVFEIAIRMYADATPTTVLRTDRKNNLTLPAVANQWGLFTVVSAFDLGFINAMPGEHLIYLMCAPNTAGTLSFQEPSGFDSYVFSLDSQGLAIR